jgi:hypothetical protein
MLNSTTLEVAIGMALIYLLLSLLCTGINEAIAGILGSRAKNLEKGIRSLFTEGLMVSKDADGVMITDASGKPLPGPTLAAGIYDHGLVQSLYQSGAGKGIANWYGGGTNLPSYIPSRTFSSALFDMLFPDDEVTAASAPAANLQHMLDALKCLPPSKGAQAMTTLVKQAGGDVERTRQAFEQWFDDGMDRAAGWYKRKTQLVLFILGLSLALSLNVDSIAVGRALWNSPALRSYAVADAETFAKTHPGEMPSVSVKESFSALQSLALPIGWNGENVYFKFAKDPSTGCYKFQHNTNGLFFAMIGWLLTAVAMTLGAPFWFDLLNQFMVVRSTIKPREKSDVEASKDPLQK